MALALLGKLFLAVVGTFFAVLVAHTLQIAYENLTSPLRRILYSPPIPNYLLGNFKETADDPRRTAEWERKYGKTFLLHGLLSVNEVQTSDLKALNHIMAHPTIYTRSRFWQDLSRRLSGEGILDQHKRQNPAFGTAQVKLLTKIFIEKSIELRDFWKNPHLPVQQSKSRRVSVVREVLRLHSPVGWLPRRALVDDVIPLGREIVGRDGRVYESLPVRKGQILRLPILEVNTSEDVWGPDALEFRPERWDDVPAAASSVPSVWAHQFTFLAGPHNCIGSRFALAECVLSFPHFLPFFPFLGPNADGFTRLKALLFTLVLRAFEMAPAVPSEGVGPVMSGQVQAPEVLGAGHGLPVVLTPVRG
uniref:Cytochrome P450 n=1 Tax=Mycena chlorophos TaxID=658473 RepID=A0ABQ0LVL6_MYCCL|nr:predicted protein [Mycena chlorophos]